MKQIKECLILILLLMFLCSFMVAGQKTLPLNNGKFKIVQFTDFHYSTLYPAAKETIRLIEEVLAAEKPDLVALTGDVVTMDPCFKGWDDVLNAVEKFRIPWAAIFGNHDEEFDKTRSEIMAYITKRPYSVSAKGPAIKGVGNYIVEVSDGKKGKKTNFLLYFMDSHAYSTMEDVKGYGWFGNDQVEWYRKNSARYAKKNGGPVPALAFFHIPLIEYASMISAKSKLVGTKSDNECPAALNSGLFLAMKESGDVMATFVGHDHDNDYIGNYCGIFLAYGRFSGSATTPGANREPYTHLPHGARVIELTAGEKGFKTWIRLEGNQIINEMNSNDFK